MNSAAPYVDAERLGRQEIWLHTQNGGLKIRAGSADNLFAIPTIPHLFISASEYEMRLDIYHTIRCNLGLKPMYGLGIAHFNRKGKQE